MTLAHVQSGRDSVESVLIKRNVLHIFLEYVIRIYPVQLASSVAIDRCQRLYTNKITLFLLMSWCERFVSIISFRTFSLYASKF